MALLGQSNNKTDLKSRIEMQKLKFSLGFLLSCFVIISSSNLQADELWYQYAISPVNNSNVKQAHAIFNDLLRANSNFSKPNKPRLYVIYSRQGPWSASLPDGSILLSEAAITYAYQRNRRSARHKLAFVIAHELALLQDKQFWHRQYFSIVGASEQAAEELQIESISSLEDFNQTANIENKSNRSALMMMSSLGYDYVEMAKDKKYYSAWLNASWKSACKDLKKISDKTCSKTKKFTQNRRSKFLKVVANQVVYDIALQAYISGDYKLARIYLEKYVRDFSHPKAHLLIGLCHLNEALDYRRKFVELGGYHKNIYVYPIMYDADTILNQQYQPIMGLDSTTGNEYNIEKEALVHKSQISRSIGFAMKSFEKAIKHDAKYKIAYANLVAAYLTLNDLPKANKFLFSRYVNRFGGDLVGNLYSGVLHASFRRSRKAKVEFSRLTKAEDPLMATLGFVNLAQVYQTEKKTRHAEQVWKKLREFSKSSTDIVVKALTNPIEYRVDKPEFSVNSRLTVAKIKPGAKVSHKLLASKSVFRLPVGTFGKKLMFYHAADGARALLNADGFVHAAWQDRQHTRSNKYRWLTKSEKQLFKKLGAPNKLVPTLKGQLLVYTDLNVAFKTNAGKIDHWFYSPQGY